MILMHAIHSILDKLSVGSFSQNIGFYTLFTLLAWIVVVQIKYKSGEVRVN
jgi:hypothetical protein